MTDEEVKLNWYAIAESGASITAIHNLREHYKNIESENKQLKTENEQIKKNWHDCFLSCSSPYCAAHFPAVEMQGELGNMSKREPEAGK